MMTQATAVKPAATKTCSTCPNFNDFHEPNGRGWCEQFDQYVRSCHEATQTCSTSLKESPKQSLDISKVELEQLREQTFPSEVLELDSDGYPVEEKTPANGYFDHDFVTYPNEPF